MAFASPTGSASCASIPGLFTAIGGLTLSLTALVQFLSQGTALFLREAGQPSEVISLVFLASLPWIMRFLWAPLIDRHGSARFGHFRSWIAATQIVIVVLFAGLLLTDPSGDVVGLMLALALLSAVMGTQQTAIFALMATYLQGPERVKGLTIMAFCYAAAGCLMGAGVLHFLGDLGWHVTVSAILAFTCLVLVALALTRLDAGRKPAPTEVRLLNQFAIFRQRAARRLLGVATLLNISVAATYGLQSLMLIDAGFSVSEASLVSIVGASAAGMAGGLLARPFVERLGGYFAAGLIGAVMAVLCMIFGLFWSASIADHWIVAFILANSVVVFGLIPALKSILMGLCGEGRKATDMSAFSGVEGFIFIGVLSTATALADTVGYGSIIFCAGLVSLLGAAAAIWNRAEHPGMETKEVQA
ncbi:MAG: MFS transporter [Pseudomonadota bacterium]